MEQELKDLQDECENLKRIISGLSVELTSLRRRVMKFKSQASNLSKVVSSDSDVISDVFSDGPVKYAILFSRIKAITKMGDNRVKEQIREYLRRGLIIREGVERSRNTRYRSA